MQHACLFLEAATLQFFSYKTSLHSDNLTFLIDGMTQFFDCCILSLKSLYFILKDSHMKP